MRPRRPDHHFGAIRATHRSEIARRPEPADHGGRRRRHFRMSVQFVARVDVGNVHLYDGPPIRLDGVDDRSRFNVLVA
jgi:hypothetical protein